MGAEWTRYQLNNVLPVPEVSSESTLVPVGLVFRGLMMGCVYLATNIVNGKMYVGKTIVTLAVRHKDHKRNALKGYGSAFCNAIRKYGFDAFKWERLYRSNDNEKLIEREIFYIKLLGSKSPNGYNLTDGGEGMPNPSLETRAKLSAANRGGKGFSGHKHLPETKAQIAATMLGHSTSAETRAKISAAGLGRRCAPETCARISAGVKAANKNKKCA